MAALATAITEFSDNGNSRTYTYTGHTAIEPHLVIQKRKTATGGSSVLEDTIVVLSSAKDALGNILDTKDTIEIKVRRDKNAVASYLTAALVIARDVMACDEFTTTVNTQGWLKP